MEEFFFKEYTVPTGFEPIVFQFTANNLLLYNTSADEIEISFDGTNVEGKLLGTPPMNKLEISGFHTHRVCLRSALGGQVVHVYAWSQK
jgi:hypothetical protein